LKAAIYKKYGSPEVVQITEVEKPTPKNNEVLIKIIATTVNRTDAGFRSAEYFVSRFWSGLFKPRFNILGCEFAGIVESTGDGVTQFKTGDKVFGYNDKTFGGHAEYICINENDAIATLPTNIDIYTAAALTEGAHYALCDIRASKIKAGEFAMVNGATGAIGSAAVQILKYWGVHVTAVCNTQNIELVKTLGADVVINYETTDFTQTEQKYHLVFDAVGKSSFKKCKPLLTKKGNYISTELGKNGVNIPLALITPLLGGKKLLFPIPGIKKEDVVFLKKLVEEGYFKPVIDRTYELESIIDAYRYVETGQKVGNVIIKI